MRKSLEPGHRLVIALRYMASGDSYASLSFNFRVATNTISHLVPLVCEAVIKEYMEEVLTCPNTPEEWKTVAEGFADKWNFHHTCGAVDGKHIAIKCPPNSGSMYLNYKKFNSIVLMALVDANYRFLFINLGANGSEIVLLVKLLNKDVPAYRIQNLYQENDIPFAMVTS